MTKLRVLFLFLYFCGSVFGTEKTAKSVPHSISEQPIRLPDSLVPLHYFVSLQPFLYGNFSIHGYVEIDIFVLRETDHIYLHMADIITQNDTVKVTPTASISQNSTVGIISQRYDLAREFYIAKLDQNLTVDQSYTISMNFIGLLNDNLVGFYRMKYTKENGKTSTGAATQFQATDARRAFPCFDEPALKANFTIELKREDGMTSSSNMPLKMSKPLEGVPGWQCDQYETSVPMPTYLVAFIISDFAYLESNESQNYDVRVWTRKEYVDQTKYAVDIGPKIMIFFEGYFNVSFPLPKQDMYALPDMAGWAMENWGLVTYQENELLHDPQLADANHIMRISTVIAHELSHQWFGNLVSPKWWTDLWLNEGFASYMEHFGMNAVDPSLYLLELIVVRYQHFAFELDCLKHSHPISVPVFHPAEIIEIFDAISYQKGASIIRMMKHFVTSETFRKGLSNYLKELAFANAEQDDLWRYLTNQAHEDGTLYKSLTVKEIMDTWTLQMGFPVLTVSYDKKSNGTIKLKQKRFLLWDNPLIEDNHDYRWWIPLTFASEEFPNFEESQLHPQEWMMPTEPEKFLENVTNVGGNWIIANVLETGYYRVNYDLDNWNTLIKTLKTISNTIDPLNRAQLLDDSLALARSGDLPYDIALDLLSYLDRESSFIPIKAALRGMTYLMDMFYPYKDTTREKDYEMLKDYFKSILTPIYEGVGFKDSLMDPNLEQMKRIKILSWMCNLGHAECIGNSKGLYRDWMADPDNFTIISPNQKQAVYCTAISSGDSAEWDFAWDRYLKATFAKERIWLLQAMGCSQNETTLIELLKRALSPNEGIRKQEVEVVVAALAANPAGRDAAWNFVQESWPSITNYIGKYSLSLRSLLENFTKFLHTPSHLADLKSFKEKYKGMFGAANRAVKQAEEIAMTNIKWRERFHPNVKKWLQMQGFGTQNMV